MPNSQEKIAIAIVQRNDGDAAEFLVGRRSADQTLSGFDEFPGGRVKDGELVSDAALRECWEETGLRLANAEELIVVDHEYDFGRLTLHFFLCRSLEPSSFEPKLPFRWVNRSSLAECSFPEANRAVIEVLLVEAP